ncbi:DUF2264 domain-containing protein [Phytohabitans houttuyneae]|uniref:DUF2264 domain-containing protein n=1 Tax=Phytohabitans houttuyneae TaxID=1076126 RepID=A0A6V8KJV5_9ACTN|nr:DUF2264 domain-containing protein [Phytohabitans houttuyneae]GFJ84144.1 hypothetical protein Phou_083240 [Phytohabitans houttuyneae]
MTVGYTRADWESLADRLLLAVRPYASPSHALVDLPGPVSRSGAWSDGLEGYARTFLLAAFRVAGAGGADPHGLLPWYARGLAAGTDPASPERWPTLHERRQARVEAASVAIALHETRPWLWDALDEPVRERVVHWLSAFIGTSGYDNNWIWFQNIAEAFLRTVGGPWSKEDIERNLRQHEGWYVGGGWYSDGGSGGGRRQNFDYYSGWAMQFYPLWYSRILGERPDPAWLERLRAFLGEARHLVGSGGAPLFQGRSLTYRFAMLAPFWTGALFGATPLPPGQTRRLAGRVVRHFVDGGSVDARGLLPIGWHGPYPRIRQLYSGPGSPYWASKAFAGLLLPPDDPVWTEPEQPLPAERSDAVVSLRAPGWVVSSTVDDGIVRIANHGSDHLWDRHAEVDDPFYKRHAYATHAAPDLSDRAHREPLDSHVALLDPTGRPSHRGRIERVAQGSHWAVSRCRAMWLHPSGAGAPAAGWYGIRTGPWLTTASALRGPVEVRLVRVDGARVPEPLGEDPEAHWPAEAGPWRVHLGGWAVAGDRVAVDSGEGWARASADGLTGAVYALRGFDDAGVSESDGANPLGARSAVPWARTRAAATPGDVLAAAVVLTGNDRGLPTLPAVEVRDGAVTVRWPGGEVDEVPFD